MFFIFQCIRIRKYSYAIGHSHQNFVKENVVSVSATGLEGASYLLINVNAEAISFERFFMDASSEGAVC